MGKRKNIKYFNPHNVRVLADLMLKHKFKTKKYSINEINKFSILQQNEISRFFEKLFLKVQIEYNFTFKFFF